MKARGFIALSLSVFLAACGSGRGCQMTTPESDLPTVSVYVLVDLSETWHNAAEKARNHDELVEVGEGIGIAASNFDPPIQVEYRVIGARSLGKRPICKVLYRPSLLAAKQPSPELVSTEAELRQVLGGSCPDSIVKQPAEPLTEISAAIVSATSEPRPPQSRRLLILLSDFKEESLKSADNGALDAARLKETKVLMIYRVLPEDQGDPSALMARVARWRKLLQDRGATVVDPWPDASVQRAQVSNFLTAE
jgi:hypothetical protein